MSKSTTEAAFKMEIKDTDVSHGHAVGKKIYFFPVSLEPELPHIFRAAIVHPHPEIYDADFSKRFVSLGKIFFQEMRWVPQSRGGEPELSAKVLIQPPSGRTKKAETTQQIRDKFRNGYAGYVSVIPLLISQRTRRLQIDEAFRLVPEKDRETTNLTAAPYYNKLKLMQKTHAYLIHKGQVRKPICSACAFIAFGISGDCHPLDSLCRNRMSIPGLSLAEEVNKLTEQRIQQFEGDFHDDLCAQSDECAGVQDPSENPRVAFGDRRYDAIVPPGDEQLGNVVAGPVS